MTHGFAVSEFRDAPWLPIDNFSPTVETDTHFIILISDPDPFFPSITRLPRNYSSISGTMMQEPAIECGGSATPISIKKAVRYPLARLFLQSDTN